MDITELRRRRLRELIDTRFNGVVLQLANHIGMKPPQLHRWLNGGQGMREDSARSIEDKLRLTKLWLDQEPGLSLSSSSHISPSGAESPYDIRNASAGPDLKARVYPLISWVQAGQWTEICDQYAPGDAEAWLQCHKELGECGYVLRVKGDSMTCPGGPYSFPPGMLLYVNPHAEALPGKFVIVRRNEHEAVFKRLVQADGEMYLESLNPNWPHRYIKVGPDDHFCGVVMHAGLELP